MGSRPYCLQRVLISSVLVFAVGACGGGSGNAPAAPGAPSAIPSGLSLTPTTDLLKVGATERFSAQVRMSDGSTRPAVSPVWGSDAPAVASIDAGGTVGGAGAGRASVYADAEGFRGIQILRVVPDYQGSWAGLYRVVQCTDTGEFNNARVCADIFKDAEVGSIVLRLTQNRDTVSGTIGLGELLGDATGTIQPAGELQLSGSVSFEEEGVKGSVRLSDWNSSMQGAEISGSFKQVWTLQGVSGDATLSCVVNGISRTSSSAAPVPSAGEAGGDIIRALVSKLLKRVS